MSQRSFRASLAAPYALLALGLAACTDGAGGPTAVSIQPVAASAQRDAAPTDAPTGLIRWNELARRLVASHRIAPPRAARIYAYLSVAGDGAAALSHDDDRNEVRHGKDGDDAAHRAAIRGASYRILSHLFVTELGLAADAPLLDAELATQRLRRDAGSLASERRGERIADALIARARSDGADLAWTGTVPIGTGLWTGTNPQLPAWGKLKPWVLRSADQFRAPPPPAFGSTRFLADLGEVRLVSDTRTADQLRIATFWADGAGSATPPGHWNQIAADLIDAHHLDERHAAHALALVNMAISDAVVGCWDSKYTYWTIRPYQVDASITTPIGRPPHPSYPSGHACSSTAAAGVLSYLFPRDAAAIQALAAESGLSRIYAGIHYRFDIEAGRALGASVAAAAVATDRTTELAWGRSGGRD